MASPDLVTRLLNRITSVSSGWAESGVDTVLPRDNSQKRPMSTFYPTVFSIEATSQEQGTFDHEEHVLLRIKNSSPASEIQGAQQLRWMHVCHDDIEFKTFVRCALEAYERGKQTDAIVLSKLSHSLSSPLEVSAFQGKRFVPDYASVEFQLPGHSGPTTVSLMAIPYFLLQQTRNRNDTQRSNYQWVRPLVQSAYHLDSSMARENQQVIRRLHGHITEVIHIPELWILNIGDKFIATCSPTLLHDEKTSSISTRTIGGGPFPPTIRITMSSGFVFCLNRDQCDVWFASFFDLVLYIIVQMVINRHRNSYTECSAQ
ncbi:hypothetical protein BO78DRAFT_140197 [Aspergillus sclerotiicarbonarius CBS 121057]|uniref:Uncharacterized protein n=1 Tax=Aspergillus sclerotiicarbonarius (strain CBS 121057 / IBT 28362) TaxID=1448318 RepID=A0A319FG02_ASPSB|nr:hypothetical protein BO78DRAFT_140197 [Aspergillus sclerotiicarbonarius CBS 121057]